MLRNELCPYPWSNAACDGLIRKKTRKFAEDSATIIDAIPVIPKSAKFIYRKTFRDVWLTIFRSMLSEGRQPTSNQGYSTCDKAILGDGNG